MNIVFTGGGTLGSVTPLLAVYEALQPSKASWIGTRRGVERELIEKEGIPFFPITSGKLRRYWDWRTPLAPFAILVGCFQAFVLLIRLRPTVIIGAGGYVQVPVILAAWLLHIPSYAIQLDVVSGLANQLVTLFVKKFFVVLEESARHFPRSKVIVTGAPVRKRIKETQKQRDRETLPVLLVLGGGTGAAVVNQCIKNALPELTKICDVIHLTGKGKGCSVDTSGYRARPFVTDTLSQYYAEADLVLTRAGMGTLSELAALQKAAIVIPLPATAQEENAALLARHDAAVIVTQDTLTREKLVDTLAMLLRDTDRRRQLGERLHETIPTDGAEKIVQFIIYNTRS